jgi:hypothetical protein
MYISLFPFPALIFLKRHFCDEENSKKFHFAFDAISLYYYVITVKPLQD